MSNARRLPSRSRSIRILVSIAACVILLAPVVMAQVTTGTIAGSVTAQSDGSPLPGVTVEAVHVPTGTHYDTVSGSNGRYTIPNVRVGGPYHITASLEGFRPAAIPNAEVRLGVTEEVAIKLQLTTVSESITVTATPDEIINPNRTGSSSAVSTEQIQALPTVNRSLQDFARTNPYFNVEAWDASSTRMTVAGRNNRYNTIQIDGAVNNDLFGLADTGTPGGQANTQPISLDAIQQIQLVVSPYDVRQGGFTGGGVNAVTRSGSNKFEGSVFGSKRNQDYVGDGPFSKPIANFDQTQYGGRLGGPILADKLFFFVNGEINRRQAPYGVSADGSTGTVYRGTGTGTTPDAALVRQYLIDTYQYDPGALGDISGKTDNNLYFGRVDWNVNGSNQLTLRHNYVDGVNDVIADRSASRFRFPTAIYTIADKTNSTVAQINTVLNSSMYNEGRLGYQTIRDIRNTPVNFPSIEIGGTGSRNGAINAGTERFSAANALDQDVLEVTDDFTWIKGGHTLTLGTHNEFFSFKNLFLSEANGYYYYKTFDDFKANKAQEYRVSFATGDDPRRPTSFDASQYGLYVSDQWHSRSDLTLTFGLRADMPRFGDTPSFNQAVETAIGYSTAETPSQTAVLSPRIGFNWAPTFGGRQQFRGGVGVFAGRTPYVWISNAFANTGIESMALSCIAPSCTPPAFNPDPNNQPHSLGSGAALSVDLIDPDFKFPRVMRTTLGYDRDLIWGIRGSVEALYSKTQEDVFYYNANRVQTGTSPLDGRPTYSKVSTAVADAALLSNSQKGHESTYALEFSRPFSHGLTLSTAYVRQDTNTAFDATSSRAISNWQFRPTRGDIFSQDDTYHSQFEVRDRYNFAATYNFRTGPLSHSVGLYWNAQAGHPYSLLMGGDPNKDLYATNDLLYVPANGLILCSSSATKIPTASFPCVDKNGGKLDPLDAALFGTFLASVGVDPSSGQILKANSVREPWARELDFHYELGLPPVFSSHAHIQFDVLNLLNMVDKDYGVVRSVAFQTYTPVVYSGQDPTTGKPVYRENFSGALNPGRQYSTADLRSRWQAKLGLRVSF